MLKLKIQNFICVAIIFRNLFKNLNLLPFLFPLRIENKEKLSNGSKNNKSNGVKENKNFLFCANKIQPKKTFLLPSQHMTMNQAKKDKKLFILLHKLFGIVRHWSERDSKWMQKQKAFYLYKNIVAKMKQKKSLFTGHEICH